MEQQHKPFEMLLDEVRAAFDREKNLKNECFLYILQRGLFDDYEKWKQQRRGCTGAFADVWQNLTKQARGRQPPINRSSTPTKQKRDVIAKKVVSLHPESPPPMAAI